MAISSPTKEASYFVVLCSYAVALVLRRCTWRSQTSEGVFSETGFLLRSSLGHRPAHCYSPVLIESAQILILKWPSNLGAVVELQNGM